MSIIESEKSKIRYGAQRYLNSQSGLSFDGVDDYIDLGNEPEYNFTDEFSISLWIRIPDWSHFVNVNRDYYLLHKSTGERIPNTTADFSYGLSISPVGGTYFKKIKFAVKGDSNFFNYLVSNRLTENTWHHLVFTFDSGIQKNYQNNVLVASEYAGITTVQLNTSPLTIDKRVYSGTVVYCKADLAHLSLYNKALDQGEVAALHTWKGHIPESAQPNLVEYQPLQYNDFIFGSVFRVTSPSQLQPI